LGQELLYKEESKLGNLWIVITTVESSGKGGISLGDFRSDVCPIGVISEQSLYFLDLYNHCQSFNCLPRPGGLLEQDNKTLEAFSVIRAETGHIDQEHAKEQQRKMRNA